MNDTLDHTDTPAAEPPVHHDPLGGYGYTPNPVADNAWWRAREAEERAERMTQHEARWLADAVLTDDPCRLEYAKNKYRRAKAAYDYATAVRQVESERRWPDVIPARGASA